MATGYGDVRNQNTFFDRVIRMFGENLHNSPHQYLGIKLTIPPLIAMIVIFFIIRKYSKNPNILKWYTIVAVITYAIYFYLVSIAFYVA